MWLGDDRSARFALPNDTRQRQACQPKIANFVGVAPRELVGLIESHENGERNVTTALAFEHRYYVTCLKALAFFTDHGTFSWCSTYCRFMLLVFAKSSPLRFVGDCAFQAFSHLRHRSTVKAANPAVKGAPLRSAGLRLLRSLRPLPLR